MRWAALTGLGLIGSVAASGTARAQADENAVVAAADAFGTKVGSDNIGLYSSTSARGFSPQAAGNVRLEGLYFDQQGFTGRAMARSTTMRVGLSAQSYPFPAPTGIADIALNIPDGDYVITVAKEFRTPVGLNTNSADVKYAWSDKVAVNHAGTWYQTIAQGGSHGQRWNVASVLRWRPIDDLEIVPFFFYQRAVDEEVTPSIYSAGNFLPPEFDRDVFFGQDWADRATDDANYGLIVRGSPWANWRLQGAIFGSDVERARNYVVNYRNVQPSGVGDLQIQKYPLHDSFSISGEMRASGTYITGSVRHTIHIATRARDTKRLFGGGHTVNLGQAQIGVYQEIAEPAYVLGVRDRDVVRQVTPGVSYGLQWSNKGEMSVGLQKSFYSRKFGKTDAAPFATNSQPWLYNATLAYNVSPRLVAYGSYTRGMEEFGTAPDNAANGGAPLPAALTSQMDAGVRYTIIPGMTLVAGVFQVEKPYFDRNLVNFYEDVGDLSHRGVELSLTGRPFTGMTVVGGAVFLKARISGLPVEQGTIANKPPGTTPRLLKLNVQYGAPSWDGFVLELQVDSESSTPANRLNTFRVPTYVNVNVGFRYNFEIYGARANIRATVNNVANDFYWTVDGNSGRFAPSGVRTYGFRVAADF
jgi:iron complex outermembrane receptor protein